MSITFYSYNKETLLVVKLVFLIGSVLTVWQLVE